MMMMLQTDTHYALLSVLFLLADSPTKAQYEPAPPQAPEGKNQYQSGLSHVSGGNNKYQPKLPQAPEGNNKYQPGLPQAPGSKYHYQPLMPQAHEGKNQYQPVLPQAPEGKAQSTLLQAPQAENCFCQRYHRYLNIKLSISQQIHRHW